MAKEQKRGRGRPRNDNERVVLKLHPETRKLLAELAEKEQITKSELVSRAIQKLSLIQ